MTIATDGARCTQTSDARYARRRYPDGFDEVNAGEIFGQHLDGIADDHLIELTHVERTRVFNLGYYTWVEQQGVPVEDFDRRKDQRFWTDARRSRFLRGTSSSTISTRIPVRAMRG